MANRSGTRNNVIAGLFVIASAVLAVVINGLAFGIAHLANATSLATSFVVAQAGFAALLGIACASLMARTRSVYPAIVLHGVVNAVVVLG